MSLIQPANLIQNIDADDDITFIPLLNDSDGNIIDSSISSISKIVARNEKSHRLPILDMYILQVGIKVFVDWYINEYLQTMNNLKIKKHKE